MFDNVQEREDLKIALLAGALADALEREEARARFREARPFARRQAELRAAMVNACTPDDMARITEKLLAMAEEGDVRAAKLLFSYRLGQPVSRAPAARRPSSPKGIENPPT
jgi:hypothetical protein